MFAQTSIAENVSPPTAPFVAAAVPRVCNSKDGIYPLSPARNLRGLPLPPRVQPQQPVLSSPRLDSPWRGSVIKICIPGSHIMREPLCQSYGTTEQALKSEIRPFNLGPPTTTSATRRLRVLPEAREEHQGEENNRDKVSTTTSRGGESGWGGREGDGR